MRYKWQYPADWLSDKIDSARPVELASLARALASELDQDQIQDLFQAEMDADDYFTPAETKGHTTP